MATTPEGQALIDALVALSAEVKAGNERQIEHREDLAAYDRSSAKSSSSSDKQHNKQQSGLLKSIVQNISLPLPGGARLFGLSSFMDKIDVSQKKFKSGQEDIAKAKKFGTVRDDSGRFKKQSKERLEASKKWRDLGKTEAGRRKQKKHPELHPDEIKKDLDKKAGKAMKPSTHALNSFTMGATAAATAVVLMTEGLRAVAKSLGGVSEGQALSNIFGALYLRKLNFRLIVGTQADLW